MTVQELGELLKIPADRLIASLNKLGFEHASSAEEITETERTEFLNRLKRVYNEDFKDANRRVAIKETSVEKLSRAAWKIATTDRYESEIRSSASRSFDPAKNDGHWNADSDSDRASK
jgi:hypothetical protein